MVRDNLVPGSATPSIDIERHDGHEYPQISHPDLVWESFDAGRHVRATRGPKAAQGTR